MAWPLVLSLLVTLPGSGPPPSEFPSFEMDELSYSVAVVAVHEAGSLPEFPGCESKTVWCLHSPTWFRGELRSLLAGTPVAETFHASTSGHYGPIDIIEEADEPTLMLLAASGTDLLMIRYAEARLFTDSHGRLHLPLWNEKPVWWLPCGVNSLAEAVTDRRLALAMASPIEPHMGRVSEDRVYRVEGRAFWPRRTVPVAKLGKYLNAGKGVRPDFACLDDGQSSPGYGFLSMVLFEDGKEDPPADE